MVAPLPQEQRFKQDFDRARLAAIRGDNLDIPRGMQRLEEMKQAAADNRQKFGYESPKERSLDDHFARLEEMKQAAADNRQKFGYGSEDNIVAQYPLGSPLPGAIDTNAIDPNNFSYLQQQARMNEGIGAPSLLPDEVANLPDPESSTEENPVTYGESLRFLEGQARNAEDIESVQAASGAIRKKMNDAMQQATEELRRLAKEKTSRLMAKAAGNGSNALDSVGWDAWIMFTLSYIYLMARVAVSILSPETQAPQDLGSFRDAVQNNAKQALHAVFPPYRPLREPGDFAYFLFLSVISVLIICVVVAVFIAVVNVFLFPIFATTGVTSSP